jgi:hypothetical protein
MPDNSDIFRAHRADPSSDATPANQVIARSAYADEIHAALERTEEAFRRGDHATAAELAWEGLETIRISVPRLGVHGIPAHYAAFFHCYRMVDEFRAALRLYKQGVSGQRRQGAVDREVLTRAWELVEAKASPVEETLPVERLVFDFPVSGRLLRAVVRLRAKLREALKTSEV